MNSNQNTNVHVKSEVPLHAMKVDGKWMYSSTLPYPQH